MTQSSEAKTWYVEMLKVKRLPFAKRVCEITRGIRLRFLSKQYITPPKFNIDAENDGVGNVPLFNYGYFGYPC